MSVGPISNPTPQVSTQQSQQLLKPAGKKNDGDGDEVNGVDPANEKANEAAKGSAQQKTLTSSITSAGSLNSTSGVNVNKTV